MNKSAQEYAQLLSDLESALASRHAKGQARAVQFVELVGQQFVFLYSPFGIKQTVKLDYEQAALLLEGWQQAN